MKSKDISKEYEAQIEKLNQRVAELEHIEFTFRTTEENLRIHQVELETQNDELRNTQLKLDAAVHSYTDLYENAPVGYLTVSEKVKIINVNTTFCNMLQTDKQHLLNDYLFKHLPETDKHVLFKHEQEEFKLGKKGKFEISFIKSSGDTFNALVEFSPRYKQANNIQTFRVTVSDITAQKTTEHLNNAVFNNPLMGLIIADKSSILELNRRAYEILGYTKEEFNVQYHNQFELIHPDDRDAALKRAKDIFTNNTMIEPQPVRFRHKDGNYIWISTYTKAIDYYGKQAILQTFTEITKQKQFELELQESEKKYRTLVDSMPIGVVMMDTEAKIIAANQQVSEILGVQIHKFLNSSMALLNFHPIHEDFSDYPYSDFPATITLQTGNPQRDMVMGVHKPDGALVWISINSEPVFDQSQVLTSVIITFADVTKQKQIQKALEESEQKFKTLFNAVPVGISVTDKIGQLIENNSISEKILGIAADEHNNRSYDSADWKIIRHDFTEMPTSEFASVIALQENRRVENVEMGMQKPNGDINWLTVTAEPLNTDNYGVIIAYTDISYKKQAEQKMHEYAQKLQELNATKDKFFSIIAHDLKSPFSSLLGFSELLVVNASKYNTEKIAYFSQLMHTTLTKTFTLLENLLEWSRIQTGKISAKPEKIRLEALIADVTVLHFEKAKAKQIDLSYNCPDNYFVFVDREMIKTVLRNLISNAIKFTKRNGKIVIAASETAGTYQISVIDNGVGISQENIEKLFRIDCNFSSPGTDDEKGTGLGLILCKEFVEKNHGKIIVKSELDKGTTFIIELPKAPNDF